MGLHYLDLDRLSEYTATPVNDLKLKTYSELENMMQKMQQDIILNQNRQNAQDKEYRRLVLKYFTPTDFLSQWFDKDFIVLACAETGVTVRDLCQEMFMEPGMKCYMDNNEFIRTSTEYVAQYDRYGRELMERAHKRVDVYRIKHKNQGICHGKVILKLLYDRYPELKKFGFSAYSVDYHPESYEIYPENHVYVSLAALLGGDIDMILFRNREYCIAYNNGRYSPDECEKAFRTDNVLDMFDTIRKAGRLERETGHLMVSYNTETNKFVSTDGLESSGNTSEHGVCILSEKHDSDDNRQPHKKYRFRLGYAAQPYALGLLLKEYLSIEKHEKIDVHVRHETDYLSDYALTFENVKNIPVLHNKHGQDISGFSVLHVFGWTCGQQADITFVLNCPGLLEP